MANQIEYTNKAVSGLSCAYANLVAYAATSAPGVEYLSLPPSAPIPSGMAPVTDSNGNPLYNSAGYRYIVDHQGALVPVNITPDTLCGNYNTLSLAYMS